ncbi:hypothetical protein [Sediminibacter sp. Hel_I_10]|uniref:hypothetical protein n=1 Tax=Sediminibacter sp. Hel_I_10 TaxID=1392490 RepID=UPI001E38C00E|nr:hypothetical protein [Sediminibacter sp. Hel_I_10]
MKKVLIITVCLFTLGITAQQQKLQYFRPNDQNGLNVFETSKNDTIPFEGVKVRVGGILPCSFKVLIKVMTLKTLWT